MNQHLPKREDVTAHLTEKEAPSVILYGIILAISVPLIAIGFGVSSERSSSLLLNVATEFIGAVVILMLVERRFRRSEAQLVSGALRFLAIIGQRILSPTEIAIARYLLAIERQQRQWVLPYYIARPVESELVRHNGNLLVVGPAGIGKTTLLLRLLGIRAAESLKAKSKGRIPILVRLHGWQGSIRDNLLAEFRRHKGFTERRFTKLLKDGRLVCLFDGLDETQELQSAWADINNLIEQCPGNQVVVSSRTLCVQELSVKDSISVLHIPGLSEEETSRMLLMIERLKTSAQQQGRAYW